MEKPYEYNWKRQLLAAFGLAAITAFVWFFAPKNEQSSGPESVKQNVYQVVPVVYRVCGQVKTKVHLLNPSNNTTRTEEGAIVHLKNIKDQQGKTFPVPVLKPLPDGVRFVMAAFNSEGRYILIPVKEKKGERNGT